MPSSARRSHQRTRPAPRHPLNDTPEVLEGLESGPRPLCQGHGNESLEHRGQESLKEMLATSNARFTSDGQWMRRA